MHIEVAIENTPLPYADYSATDNESDDEEIGEDISRPHHNDEEPSTSTGLKAFYEPPNIDFIAIDEDEEEEEINDDVAEIRSQMSVPDVARKRMSIRPKPLESHTV